MTDMTFTAVARRIVQAEVRNDRDYAAMVDMLNLTHETSAADLTSAARGIVVEGAPARLGIATEDLAGRDPGADAAHRVYWKAARAIRAGLVRAITPAEDDDTTKPAVMRVTLSGEGGGSTVVPADHPLYLGLVALLAEGK